MIWTHYKNKFLLFKQTIIQNDLRSCRRTLQDLRLHQQQSSTLPHGKWPGESEILGSVQRKPRSASVGILLDREVEAKVQMLSHDRHRS